MSPRFAKAYLEITNLCNLSCRFCHGTKRSGEFMPTERFTRLTAELRPYPDYLYLHVLGEPLLHPELPDILETAASLGFRLCITTNGTLLGEREELLLSFAPHIHKISVSLHASESNGCRVGDNYLADCLSFAKNASEAGMIVALRLWNLEGNAKTPSENKENDAVLSALSAAFSHPWQDTRSSKKLKERVYLMLHPNSFMSTSFGRMDIKRRSRAKPTVRRVKGGSGSRTRTGDLRIMIPTL